MTWMFLELPRERVSELTQIQDALTHALLATGRHKGVRIFWRRQTSKPYLFYFSPAAAAIIAPILSDLGATACEEPDTSQLDFFGGDANP